MQLQGINLGKQKTSETRITGGTSVAQIRKLKTNEIGQLYRACCAKNSNKKDDLVIFGDFCNEANIIYFLDSMSQFLLSPSLKAKTWHKT